MSSTTPTGGVEYALRVVDDMINLDKLVLTHHLTIELQQRKPNIQMRRSVLDVKPEHLPYSLLGTTLSGPEAMSPPYVFIDDENGSLLAFYHLGCRLAGHAGIVHGGIPAVILDECMGRACFPRLPETIAVTAKLEIEYRNPIAVNSVIVVQAETKEVQGRKAFVEAKVQEASGSRVLVEAKGLFVQPKWASEMSQMM